MARKPSKTRSRRPARGGGPPRESAYERRIRLYIEKHPGASRAQARGHRPSEHETRRKRAEAEGRLTERERAAIRRFARRNARRREGADPDEIYSDMLAWARERGFGAFDAMRSQVADLEKRGASRVRIRMRGKVAHFEGNVAAQAANVATMEGFATRHGVSDIQWLYYH